MPHSLVVAVTPRPVFLHHRAELRAPRVRLKIRPLPLLRCVSTIFVLNSGNGPSGISMSYMLAGHLPRLVSCAHPDEMLAARLRPAVGESLIAQDLDLLSLGLEGRTTNPVSLLLDALAHPCADLGLETEPLVEWRKDGVEVGACCFVIHSMGEANCSWVGERGGRKMEAEVITDVDAKVNIIYFLLWYEWSSI